MSTVVLHFTKISGERKTGPLEKIQVTNNTSLTDVSEAKVGSTKVLRFLFTHTTTYQPQYATFTLQGELLLAAPEKDIADTIASYKKGKTFGPQLTQKVYNTILTRASVQTLLLARELNLPPPFKLPRVTVNRTVEAGAEKGAPAKQAEKPKKK